MGGVMASKKQYWLLKSEPSAFSIQDLEKSPKKTTYWSGVRNFQARKYLRDEIKVGDEVFFYHSNADPPAIVGTAEVVKSGYPDHTALDPKDDHYDPKSTSEHPIWYMVDIRHQETFSRPITLPELKKEQALSDMVLLHKSRLSVQPVTEQEWQHINKMQKRVLTRS
jgi:predicted RNA-binding protein with PUA-like domain